MVNAWNVGEIDHKEAQGCDEQELSFIDPKRASSCDGEEGEEEGSRE